MICCMEIGPELKATHVHCESGYSEVKVRCGLVPTNALVLTLTCLATFRVSAIRKLRATTQRDGAAHARLRISTSKASPLANSFGIRTSKNMPTNSLE